MEVPLRVILSWKKGYTMRANISMPLYSFIRIVFIMINPLSANPTKWSNTLKQFVGKSQQIVSVCLIILWG